MSEHLPPPHARLRHNVDPLVAPFTREDRRPVGWRTEDALVPYDLAIETMEARAAAIAEGRASELVWVLEHPPLYTAGTSAQLSGANALDLPHPIHQTGRGGQITYHGPGQRIAYAMLDLSRRRQDVRAFVGAIEHWIIGTLATFGVQGERREDRVGVWVARPDKAPGPAGEPAEDKIAAIGIRVRRWVSFHGLSLNVEPQLGDYGAITPCGISARHLGVTSLADLGVTATMPEVDMALRAAFEPIFGRTIEDGSA